MLKAEIPLGNAAAKLYAQKKIISQYVLLEVEFWKFFFLLLLGTRPANSTSNRVEFKVLSL